MPKMKKYLPAFVVAILIFGIGGAFAMGDRPEQKARPAEILEPASNVDLSGTPWEGLRVPVGTKLSISKSADGTERKILNFPGGVSMSQIGNNVSIGVDHSGHGAVMCAWGVYVDVRSKLEKCSSSPGDEEFKEKLDNAIDKINNFIVANSLSKITKSELEDQIKKNTEHLPYGCMGYPDSITNKLRSMPVEKFKSSLDDLLSVPRPPVMEPCL